MTVPFTSSDNVRLSYADFGPRDGRALVLCHGLMASGRQFKADAKWFAGLGYRVLVPDVRGHGVSGAPTPISAENFTIVRLARDMIEMLDAAEAGPVDWVGNSLGGIVALEIARTAPARLRSLASFGTAYRLDLPDWAPGLFAPVFSIFGPRLVSIVAGKMTTRDRAAQRLVSEITAGFDPRVGQAIAENVRQYDLIAAGRDYPGPVLLLRGARDFGVNRALPATLGAMASHPDFTLIELAGAGHCANLDRPETVRAALVEFWEKHPRAIVSTSKLV